MAAESNLMGQAGGLAYTFQPMNRPAPVQQEEAQPTGTPFDTPTPPDAELANVENLTGNYYNAYSRLKDFTNTMWQDYGLDVTKPDLSQPGGGQFYQAYVNMDANLRMTAQDLKQQRKFMEEAYTSQLAGKSLQGAGFDPTKTLYTEAPRAGEYSTTLLPAVIKALDGVSNVQYGTQAEADRAWATLIPLRQSLEAKRDADPYNAQYWQMQIDALRKPTWEQKQFASRDGSGFGLGDKKVYEPYIKPALENKGYWDPNKVSYRVVNGKVVAALKADEDEQAGLGSAKEGDKTENKMKLVDFRYIGSDGNVYVRYKPPFDKEDAKVSNLSADQSIASRLEQNPKYGKVEDWNQYIAERGLRNKETEDVPLEKLMNITDLEKASQMNIKIKQDASKMDSYFRTLKETEKEKYTTATSKSFGSMINPLGAKNEKLIYGPFVFTPNYTNNSVDIVSDDKKAFADAYFSATGKKLRKVENLTWEDVNSILEETGYYNKALDEQQKKQAAE